MVMKVTAISTTVERRSSRMPSHLVMTRYRYQPYWNSSIGTCISISLCSDLCVLIVEGVKAIDGYVLLPKRPDGGQTLKGGGDVRVHWTTSCKQTNKQTKKQTNKNLQYGHICIIILICCYHHELPQRNYSHKNVYQHNSQHGCNKCPDCIASKSRRQPAAGYVRGTTKWSYKLTWSLTNTNKAM